MWLLQAFLAAAMAASVLVGLAIRPVLAADPQLKVIASIKPVHALVAGVMQGVAESKLLLATGASPHTFSLKPSDARSLAEADVVFWVGAGLETFLAKPLQTLPRATRVVALHQAEGVKLLPYRQGGIWSQHDHDHHAHDHGHDHGRQGTGAEPHDEHTSGQDMHLWLDPANAQAMVTAIARTLAARDPGNAEIYQRNANLLRDRLVALDNTLATELAPFAGRPYLVFHDAYQYFEARYGLSPVGAITVSPEQSPGAKQLRSLRERIVASKALCVFSEPQFSPKLVTVLVQGSTAKSAVLDPLGTGEQPGVDAYFAMMRGLASSLRDCLGAGN